jgi:thiol:disulfide interchange protein
MQNRLLLGSLALVAACGLTVVAMTSAGQSGRRRDAQPARSAAPAQTPAPAEHDSTPSFTTDDVQAPVAETAPVGHAPDARSVARAAGPISWQKSFAKARTVVKADQFIFVDVYTDWCGYCKLMDRDIYTDGSVQSFAADNVFVKLNAEDRGEGSAFAARMGVRGFPALLVFSHDGKLIGQQTGAFRRAPDFLAWLQATSTQR